MNDKKDDEDTQNAYRLKWNDFEPNIITSAFGSIREDGELFDVTLVARGGRSIKAHKMVLAACSPLFRSMLRRETHPHPMIFLKGVRYADIHSILNFMYKGEVNVKQDDLPTFLEAAEELKIRGLSDKTKNQNNPEEVTSKNPSRISSRHNLDSDGEEVEEIDYETNSSSTRRDHPPEKRGRGRPRKNVPGETPSKLARNESYGNYEDNDGAFNEDDFGMLDPAVRDGTIYASMLSEPYSLHQLGGKMDDPMSTIMVAQSERGWHCSQCPHVTTTKGNLKSHILSGRHKGNQREKDHQCEFCHKYYGSRQSLQVHISANHRELRDSFRRLGKTTSSSNDFFQPSALLEGHSSEHSGSPRIVSSSSLSNQINPNQIKEESGYAQQDMEDIDPSALGALAGEMVMLPGVSEALSSKLGDEDNFTLNE